MQYSIYAPVYGTKYIGQVEADSVEEALEKAMKELSEEMHVSVCHQCSDEVGDVDIGELIVEPIE